MDRSGALVAWDDEDDPEGNVQHIAEHGLTPDEVESVLLDPEAPDGISRSSGRPMVTGFTYTGRLIRVIFEVVSERPLALRPITAFELVWD